MPPGLEIELWKMKISWYEKLLFKIDQIETGKMTLHEYRLKVKENVRELENEIELAKAGMDE